MNLTPEVLANSPQYIGPVGDLTLDLRDQRLTSLLALDTLKSDIYTVWDLSNNKIRQMPTLSRRLRVKVLLLANNELESIPDLQWAENLETLSLINNNIKTLNKIEGLKNLKSIYLLGNCLPKTYRIMLIKMIPSLEVIDFQKVKKAEREMAMSYESEIAIEENENLDEQINKATTLDQLENLERLF